MGMKARGARRRSTNLPDDASWGCRILVVDGHRLAAEALARALQIESPFEIVGVSTDAQEAIRDAQQLQPEIAILHDPLMDRPAGPVAAEMRGVAPNLKILVLVAHPNPTRLAAWVEAGAVGCVTTDQPLSELINAIRLTAAGDVLFPSGALADLVRSRHNRDNQVRRVAGQSRPPTPRELQILSALAGGLDVSEIAGRFGISTHTVRTHMRGAMVKLGARSPIEATLSAVKAGLIELV